MTTSSQISDTNVSDLKEFIIEVTIPLLGKQCAENEYNDTIYFTDGTLRIVQNDSKITIVANQTSGYPFYMNHTLHHVLGESWKYVVASSHIITLRLRGQIISSPLLSTLLRF